jgi:hypothetical protein
MKFLDFSSGLYQTRVRDSIDGVMRTPFSRCEYIWDSAVI